MAQNRKMTGGYKWIYPQQQDLSPEIVKAAGSKMLASLLLNRGMDSPEKITAFLDLDNAKFVSPFVFADMQKSVERINKAVSEQEHIVVYGDFDADGVTSTSLLFKTLKHIGADASYFIPDRADEGHGLSSSSVCRLISAKKAKLIITVDCGISNVKEITLANGLGTDVIITDHHEVPEIVPPAYAIINPKLLENNDEIKDLAGVGVAFKLACALLEVNNKQDFIDKIICLVAVGTIADVVPLLGENRALVHHGLRSISYHNSPGLVRLLETAGCKLNEISAESIAYGVAPRINAIGRLAAASLAVELLVSDNAEEIEEIARKLNYNNKIRQQMCESTFVEAISKIEKEIDPDDKAVILSDSNWHPGIIGIVASKIVEKYYKPALLISIDKEGNLGRCSARGVEGLKLHEVLSANEDLFEQFGGHALAAGFSFDLNKFSYEEVKNRLLATISSSIDYTVFEPKLKLDMNISFEDLSLDLMEELNKLAPFGEGNPSPAFSISGLTLKQFKTMGSSNNHLKIFLSDDNNNLVEAVWWQKDSLDAEVLEKVNVAFSPDVNTFGGKTKLQLIVKDIQVPGSIIGKEEQEQPKSITLNTVLDNLSSTTCKWIDHRKKTNFEKSLINYIRLSKNRIAVFAESQNSLELLGKDNEIKSKIINRIDNEHVDELFIFDLFPDLDSMVNLLEKTCPKTVHLIGINMDIDSNKLIKTISGMLKYAHANKNGEVNISQIASLLNTSSDNVLFCIDLLDKAGVIKLYGKETDPVKFAFVGSKDLSALTELEEYSYFIDSLKAEEDFRNQLMTLDIQSIQNLV